MILRAFSAYCSRSGSRYSPTFAFPAVTELRTKPHRGHGVCRFSASWRRLFSIRCTYLPAPHPLSWSGRTDSERTYTYYSLPTNAVDVVLPDKRWDSRRCSESALKTARPPVQAIRVALTHSGKGVRNSPNRGRFGQFALSAASKIDSGCSSAEHAVLLWLAPRRFWHRA